MRLTNSQRANGRAPVGRRFPWLGLWAWLACGSAVALGQAPFVADPYQGAPDEAPDTMPFDQFSGRNGDALGAVWRGGFITGPALGREDSIAPIEMMPYFFLEDTMVFGDLRGFRSVEDNYGFNTGFGFRRYLRKTDRIIGANFYYDYDNTSGGQLFRQVGGGLEFLGPAWDMRLNTYFPVTQNTKEISLSDPFNIRFNANNILFDQIRTFGVHQKGLDHELAVPLPSRYMERHNVKAVAGWYHFQQTGSENTWGWKGRLEGDLTANVHLGLEVTNDNTFDTNVVFSVAMSYGGFREPEGQRRTTFSRMTDHVHRQYTAVVAKVPVLEAGIVANKPDGTPIFVEHVAGNNPYDRANVPALLRLAPQYDPGAPLGTFENPFLTVAEAQDPLTPLSDITYVWTNSVYNNTPLTTESGNRLLGESDNAPHTFLINGQVALVPRAVNNTDANVFDEKPLYQNTVGDGVILTPGLNLPGGGVQITEFSGFSIGDEQTPGSGPTGHGIRALDGDDVTNVQVNYNDVNFAALDGIRLEDVGRVNMVGNRIFNSGADGLHIIDGTPQINFFRDVATSDNFRLEIQNDDQVTPTGYAVHIERVDQGALINMAGTSPSRIDYLNAGAVLVDDGIVDPAPPEATGGNVLFGEITVVGSPLEAINILGSSAADSGTYTFSNPISITGSIGDSINIENQEGTSGFLSTIDINNRGGRGIDLRRNDGAVFFNGAVDIDGIAGGLVTSNLAAIEYQESLGDVTFREDITLTGGGGDGILIGEDNPADPSRDSNNSGQFRVTGQADIETFGGIGIRILEDDSRVVFNDDVTLDGISGFGILVDRQRSPVAFNADTTVNGTGLTTSNTPVVLRGTNVFLQDPLRETAGSIFFNRLSINNGFGNFQGAAGIAVVDMQAPVLINELEVEAILGTALHVRNAGDPYTDRGEGSLQVRGGSIDASVGTGIDVQDSKINLQFDSVTVNANIGNGIRMVNNASQTGGRTLTVTGGTGLDGGSIVAVTQEGGLFVNTGNILLNFMEFDANLQDGILVQNIVGVPVVNGTPVSIGEFGDDIYTNTVEILNTTSTNNLQHGLQTINIPEVILVGGVYEDNGDLGALGQFPEISLFYNRELVDLGDRTTDDDDIELEYLINITNVTASKDVEGANTVEIGTLNQLVQGTPNIDLTMLGTDRSLAVFTKEDDAFLATTSTLLIAVDGNLNADIQGYTFVLSDEGDVGAAAVRIDQQSDEDFAVVNFVNNIVNNTADVTASFGLNVRTEGVASFIVNDNLFIMEDGTDGSTAVFMDFNNETVLTFGGTADNVYPTGFPDDANFGNPNQAFGNVIIMNGLDSIAVELDFADTSVATIENNLIDNTSPLFLVTFNPFTFNQGISITARDTLALNGNLDNLVFLDTFDVFGNPLVNAQGAGFPWFSRNGTGVINGSILVNGVPQP